MQWFENLRLVSRSGLWETRFMHLKQVHAHDEHTGTHGTSSTNSRPHSSAVCSHHWPRRYTVQRWPLQDRHHVAGALSHPTTYHALRDTDLSSQHRQWRSHLLGHSLSRQGGKLSAMLAPLWREPPRRSEWPACNVGSMESGIQHRHGAQVLASTTVTAKPRRSIDARYRMSSKTVLYYSYSLRCERSTSHWRDSMRIVSRVQEQLRAVLSQCQGVHAAACNGTHHDRGNDSLLPMSDSRVLSVEPVQHCRG